MAGPVDISLALNASEMHWLQAMQHSLCHAGTTAGDAPKAPTCAPAMRTPL
jgi:hypothetical protein